MNSNSFTETYWKKLWRLAAVANRIAKTYGLQGLIELSRTPAARIIPQWMLDSETAPPIVWVDRDGHRTFKEPNRQVIALTLLVDLYDEVKTFCTVEPSFRHAYQTEEEVRDILLRTIDQVKKDNEAPLPGLKEAYKKSVEREKRLERLHLKPWRG